MTMTKSLNDVTVGDTILAMGEKTFTEPLSVLAVSRFDAESKRMVTEGGSVVFVKMQGGRFWTPQPGRAEITTVTVLA